jgi:cell division cycle 20, cofactor of APC complex
MMHQMYMCIYITQYIQVRCMDGHASRVSALSWNRHVVSTGGRDTNIVNHDVRVQSHIVATLKGHSQEVCMMPYI